MRKYRRIRVLGCASEFIAGTIPVIGSTFYVNSVTLAILVKMVDSGVSWVVVQVRSFLTPKSRVLTGFWPVRLRNVRLAALDLRWISGVDLEGSRLDPGILGFSVFFT